MTSPDHEPIMQKSLQNLFGSERDRAQNAKNAGELLSKPEEMASIGAYRSENSVIPPEAYETIDLERMIPDDFKLYWGNNSLCCAVSLPFDDGGNNRAQMQTQGTWDSFLNRQQFLRLLSVMPNSKLTNGFGSFASTPARYFELLPEELRRDVDEGGCTFYVIHRNPQQLYDADDRARFITNCNKALQNLERFLASGNLFESLN